MASTSETGHAKNVANFEILINFCIGYGPTYNPSKAALKIPVLNTTLTTSQTSLQTVKVAKTTSDNNTNQREISFDPLKKLATRVVNALASTDAAKQTVDDAKTTNNKIQGKRAGKKPGAPAGAKEGEVPKSASTSQQSFDKLIDHFTQLIQTLTAEPAYAPNEAGLKVTALNTVLTSLKTNNTAVINSNTALSNARIERDKILYADLTGLCDIAVDIKQYVKSVFGATSPQYKQVSAIKFTTRNGK